MAKLIFTFTNFIGIRVENIKLPSCVDIPENLRSRYSDLLPELFTMVRPFFYIATSSKSEAAYIRELEGIPDLYPLESYPGKRMNNATMINMVGLYIDELADTGIDQVESACQIIEQTLNDVGLIFNKEDIEIILSIPNFYIDLSEDRTQENCQMEENKEQSPQEQSADTTNNNVDRPKRNNNRRRNKGKNKGGFDNKKPRGPRPVTIGDMLGPEFVEQLMKKVRGNNPGRRKN